MTKLCFHFDYDLLSRLQLFSSYGHRSFCHFTGYKFAFVHLTVAYMPIDMVSKLCAIFIFVSLAKSILTLFYVRTETRSKNNNSSHMDKPSISYRFFSLSISHSMAVSLFWSLFNCVYLPCALIHAHKLKIFYRVENYSNGKAFVLERFVKWMHTCIQCAVYTHTHTHASKHCCIKSYLQEHRK